jgi:hypothetical protein
MMDEGWHGCSRRSVKGGVLRAKRKTGRVQVLFFYSIGNTSALGTRYCYSSTSLGQNLFQAGHNEAVRILIRKSSNLADPGIHAGTDKSAADTRMGYKRVRIDPCHVSNPGSESRIGRKYLLKLLSGKHSFILLVGVARIEVYSDGVHDFEV